jgi:hypothetical protein
MVPCIIKHFKKIANRLATFVSIVTILCYGATCLAQNKTPPIIAKVGIHLLGISDLDLKGTYNMDFHVIFNCNKICPRFQLELLNGTISSIEEEASTPTAKIYRVTAKLQETFDARRYPFDRYNILLLLKDQLLDKSKLIFLVDPHLIIIDPNVILHGWENTFHIKVLTTTFVHPLTHKAFSEFIFRIQLVRPPLRGFLKNLFPAFIIVFFAFISFFIRPQRAFERFGIVSGTLIGSVLFHINVTSSLPPIGYLTYIDMVMITNYLTIFLVLLENILMMRLSERRQNIPLSTKIDYLSIIAILGLWVFLQAANALYFLR